MKKCNVLSFTGLMGKKWTFVILEQIALNKDEGFNFLTKKIKNISPKILSSRLKELELAEFLDKDIEQNPLRSHYKLSKKGKEIYQIFKSLKLWNSKYSENCYKKECANCELLQ
ncbi:helix-turn-helix transcriptional regulator [Candidatus Woesearchaeota archaeon]|nr:helix-turn-helix transcriptional regulator [Candidatus Woesearchaeota archaeon]